MEYYIIYQDERIYNFTEPTGVAKVIDLSLIKRGKIEALDDSPVQVYIKEKSENEYIDFIDKPVTLISENLKQVFDAYDEKIFFKPVVFADAKRMKQDLYWLMVPEGVKCLSSDSEFNRDETLKKLVIDEERVGFSKIFKVSDILEDIIVVNQDVAESILRRDFTGIRLKKVQREVKGSEYEELL